MKSFCARRDANIEVKHSGLRCSMFGVRCSMFKTAIVIFLATLLSSARAEGPSLNATSAVDRAVARGINFLLTKQDDDGAIGKVDRKS